MNNNDEFLKNMRVNVNPDDLENAENAVIPLADETSDEYYTNTKGFISSIFESKIDNQKNKIENLNNKISVLRDKIQKNNAKIDKLNFKIGKLEKQNKFLETIAKAYPKSAGIFQSRIEKNLERISTIRNEKIPKRLDKIDRHNEKINRLEKKIERRNLKISTFENIQNYFDSFFISNPEQRHDNFISCLKAMNDSAVFKAQNKIARYSKSLNDFQEKSQFLRKDGIKSDESTREWINSTLEKYDNRIAALQSKIQFQNQKLEKYTQLESGMTDINSKYSQERSNCIETVMQEDRKEFQSFSESLASNMSSAVIADRILTHNADFIRNTLELSKTGERISGKENADKTVKGNIQNKPYIGDSEKAAHSRSDVQKKPSLLNKLKENEKAVRQHPVQEKSHTREQMSM